MPGECAINKEENNGLVLLNEPDEIVRDALTVLLEEAHWTVRSASSCADMLSAIRGGGVVAVISESSLPDCTPDDILEHCKAHGVPVIFTGHELSLQGAVDLIRQGAMDFLDKPFPQARLLNLLDGLHTQASMSS